MHTAGSFKGFTVDLDHYMVSEHTKNVHILLHNFIVIGA